MKKGRRIVAFRKFCTGIITLLILANAIIAGILTNTGIKQEYRDSLNLVCEISAVIFIVEMIVRMSWNKTRFWKGRKRRWNLFDLFITVLSAISLLYINNTLITLRIFREVRVLRIFSRFKNLRMILDALIDSFSKLAWTGVLFLVIYYLYAVFGVEFFGKDYPELFGNLAKAMFTLFQIMTLDNWNVIVRETVMIYPYSWTFFISFILIVSYIFLNLIVGIIVSSLEARTNNVSLKEIKKYIEAIEDKKQEGKETVE